MIIYYLEDDRNIRDLVVYTLGHSGYDAHGFSDASSFWSACAKTSPDLVLLDIMLPREDGLTVLGRLRKDAALRAVPVIMVTAKGAEYDKVVGLDMGADDYIVKPFGMMELVSRVRALLRRVAPPAAIHTRFSFAGIILDTAQHIVLTGGVPVVLTYKEFELLRTLMEQPGQVFSREQLLSRVWGYEYGGGTRTVDVHVQTLRQKLGAYGSLIQTVRGVGYKLGGTHD